MTPRPPDFKALKAAIDECLGALSTTSEDPFVATLGGELRRLIDLLQAQIPQRVYAATVDQYRELHKPKIPNGASRQMAAVALKRWELEVGRKYDEYVLEFNERHKVQNETIDVRERIVSNLRRKLERQLAPRPFDAQRLPWRLLGPDGRSFQGIMEHFDRLSRGARKEEIDKERLEKVHGLGPSQIYIGIDEFEWYIVFLFRSVDLAVLECPIKGNAIYLIAGDWQSLSKLSKTSLLDGHAGEVKRIIHAGDWYAELKKALYARRRK
jgi:hypothetical protein